MCFWFYKWFPIGSFVLYIKLPVVLRVDPRVLLTSCYILQFVWVFLIQCYILQCSVCMCVGGGILLTCSYILQWSVCIGSSDPMLRSTVLCVCRSSWSNATVVCVCVCGSSWPECYVWVCPPYPMLHSTLLCVWIGPPYPKLHSIVLCVDWFSWLISTFYSAMCGSSWSNAKFYNAVCGWGEPLDLMLIGMSLVSTATLLIQLCVGLINV